MGLMAISLNSIRGEINKEEHISELSVRYGYLVFLRLMGSFTGGQDKMK